MPDQTPDYTAARDYATRVLADPNYHSAEELAAARVLRHLLPAPTLAETTFVERGNTIGMWATVDPGEGRRPWRGIIAAANRNVALVANPTAMRMSQKPTRAPADTVTPDPSVPRAWKANGTPAHPEPAPDSTLTPGSTWSDGAHLNNTLDQSAYASAVVIDRDNDLAMWTDGYWEGPGFKPGNNPGEGPWKIIWVGPEQ